ncbi:hypothetical protein RHMOL_Rhmol06G0318900 [Rhododendron molle]|uniref:Uncharacterized protein n=1 Tax=Rhododendron molle TaxID=49168 RepID=A0ACC0NJM9_RHOML|nr:hypothetical protein RHMOL_Rhmol06G0318900 [Rhododendron molle]
MKKWWMHLERQAHTLLIGQQQIIKKIKEIVEKLNQQLTIQVPQQEDANSQTLAEGHGNSQLHNVVIDQIDESKVKSDDSDALHFNGGEDPMEQITLVPIFCGLETLGEDVEESHKIDRGSKPGKEAMLKLDAPSNLVPLHEGG